jgi:hypothetical protein
MGNASTRTLERALAILGSKEALAAALRLTPAEVDALLGGKKEIPHQIFLQLLDIVAGKPRTPR